MEIFTDSVQWNLGTGQMRFLKKDAVRDLQVLKTLTSTTDVCKTCQNSQFFCFGSVVVGWGRSGSATPQVSVGKHRLRQKQCSETKVNEITCVASRHNNMK